MLPRRKLARLVAVSCIAMGFASVSMMVLAQSAQLTPEQQRMLNQLPPAQRQQALDALRQMQTQNDGSANELSSLTEELTPAPLAADALSADLLAELTEVRAGSNSRLVVPLPEREYLAGKS